MIWKQCSRQERQPTWNFRNNAGNAENWCGNNAFAGNEGNRCGNGQNAAKRDYGCGNQDNAMQAGEVAVRANSKRIVLKFNSIYS